MNYFNELYMYQDGIIKFFDKHDFLLVLFGSTGSNLYSSYYIPDENCSHLVRGYKNHYFHENIDYINFNVKECEIFNDESKLHEKYGKPTDIRPHYAHEGIRHMDDDQLCEYLRDWILRIKTN